MPEDLSPDDRAIIEKALQSMRSKDRHSVPSHKVKLFLQMVGDELKRTGSLKKEYVDGLVRQVKSGEL
jgi:hypothetical protein